MPTYEYRCDEGHLFERFQKMSDDPVRTCPQCGAAAERLLSAGAGLLFKGSGFYITDHRDKDYKSRASADSAGAPSGAPPSDGNGKDPAAPSKPESKSDSASDSGSSKADG